MIYRMSALGAVLLLLLFTLAAWSMFVGELGDLVRGFSSRKWPHTSGVVLSSGVDSTPGSSVHWYPVITYRYRVDGDEYDSNVIAFHSLSGPHVGSNRDEAQKFADQYEEGAAVDVYYDPQDPSICVLQPGASYTSAFGPIFSLVILALGVTILWVLWRSKSDPRLTDEWDGKERTCPECGNAFVSVQNKGGCPQCGHVFYASDSVDSVE